MQTRCGERRAQMTRVLKCDRVHKCNDKQVRGLWNPSIDGNFQAIVL
jgi:hypothetical protein